MTVRLVLGSRSSYFTPHKLRTPTPRWASTAPTAPAPASTGRSLFFSLGLAAGALTTGYALAIALPRPQLLSLLYPTPTLHAPPADSTEGLAHAKKIEDQLQNLKVVRELRSLMAPAPGTSAAGSSLERGAASEAGERTELVKQWTEARPYSNGAGPHSLTGFSLRGPGKFSVPPIVFTSRDLSQAVLVMHLGTGLCGHEGVVHGGLLATILDESIGRTALLNLPTNIGVTATLKVSYKKPCFADNFVVIRTELVEQKGRKAVARGWVESLEGERLCEAEGLFVEPKMAKFLSNSSVKEALQVGK